MNFSETKFMFNQQADTVHISVDRHSIERIESYVYLEQTEIILGHDNQVQELKRRIQLGWAAYCKLKDVISMKILPKWKVYIHCSKILNRDLDTNCENASEALERKLVEISIKDRKE